MTLTKELHSRKLFFAFRVLKIFDLVIERERGHLRSGENIKQSYENMNEQKCILESDRVIGDILQRKE